MKSNMKKLTVLLALLGIALLQTALADPPARPNKKKSRPAHAAAARAPGGGQHVAAARAQHRAAAPQTANAGRRANVQRSRAASLNTPGRGRGKGNAAAQRATNIRNARSQAHAARAATGVTAQPRANANGNRRTTRAVVINNWRGDRFRGGNYAAFRNYHREFHDRNWYRRNHSRIVFYFGAPYYWNTGYWYPAWGYNPGYSYQYDGPIYGYNGLPPDQVLISVQTRLQADGYYRGAVDGTMGPLTRQALANYQTDRGLAVTAAVDQPTLVTLGLT